MLGVEKKREIVIAIATLIIILEIVIWGGN
jgi:hypothetical protein